MTDQTKPLRKRLQVGQLFRDYIILSGGQLMSKIMGFAVFAYLARILTVSDYGAVETVVGMSVIGYKVVEFGTGAIAVRWISQGVASLRETVGAVVSARFLIALIIIPLLGALYVYLSGDEIPPLLIWFYAGSLIVVPFIHEWLFQAYEKMGIVTVGPLLRMFVFVGVIIVLAPGQNGVLMIGVAEILSLVAIAVFFSLAARFLLGVSHPDYGVTKAVKVAKQSAPLGGAAFLNSFGLYIPVLIVAAVAGGDQTGFFGAAHRIIASAATFSFIYYFNIFPLFSRLLKQDPARLQGILSASARVTGWIGITAALGLWTLGDPIMTIIFTEDFAGAGPIFKVLAWMIVFELISGNARWLLVAAQRQSSLLLIQGAGAFTAIILTLVLADIWGGIGAAIAVVAANSVIWVIAHWRTEGLAVRVPLLPLVAPAIVAFLCFALLVFWHPAPLVSAIVAGVVMAGAALLDPKFLPAIRLLAGAKNAT